MLSHPEIVRWFEMGDQRSSETLSFGPGASSTSADRDPRFVIVVMSVHLESRTAVGVRLKESLLGLNAGA